MGTFDGTTVIETGSAPSLNSIKSINGYIYGLVMNNGIITMYKYDTISWTIISTFNTGFFSEASIKSFDIKNGELYCMLYYSSTNYICKANSILLDRIEQIK